MKLFKLVLLVCIIFLGCDKHPKTLSTDIYYLDYYNEESPAENLWIQGEKIETALDGSINILSFQKDNTTEPIYRKSYDAKGLPISFLNGPDFSAEKGTLFYRDSVKINFKGKDTLVAFKRETFINPIVLWFWKTQPTIGEKVTVSNIVKNFITNTIGLSKTHYTYKGLDSLNINNTISAYHKVHSYWGKKEDNNYDESWYNKEGLLVKQIHHVGTHGKRIAKLSKIVVTTTN